MAKAAAQTEALKGWITRQDMARFFDVRPEHWDKSYREAVPDRYIKTEGRRIWFDPRSIRAIYDAGLSAEREKANLANGDPMLSAGGSDSPALERFRLAKAQSAELDLAERHGELVRVDVVETVMQDVASRIRQAGEHLGRVYGADAQAILDQALDESEAEIRPDTSTAKH